MTDRLKGKVAIITGGTAGIGRAAVERFCEEGAQVAFMARREAEGRAVEAAVRAAGGDATFIPCDVTERASLETAVQAAIDAYGRLDILVNNAGGGLPGEFPRESLQVWEDVLRLNLTAPFLMTRICWDHLVQSGNGVVLNVSSSAAVCAHTAETRKWMEFVSPASYHAAKAGLEAFTRYVAGAGSEHNVRANVVRPGLIATLIERWRKWA